MFVFCLLSCNYLCKIILFAHLEHRLSSFKYLALSLPIEAVLISSNYQDFALSKGMLI